MNQYRKHAHNRSIGWSTWHFQWCTKYRYKIFGSSDKRNFCKVLLSDVGNKFKIDVLDLEIDSDHVHVIASLPLTMTPTYALNVLKGKTAKAVFIQYPELKRVYKKGHLWSPGKFIGSIGHITLDKAKAYLEAHHAKSDRRNPCP